MPDTIEELNKRIADIRAAAYGMGVPLTAGQLSAIAEYERKIEALRVPETSIRKAATGQTIRINWTAGAGFYVTPGALVHLTDGTPYSRTGHNVRALCGVSVRPETFEERGDVRICAACASRQPLPEALELPVDPFAGLAESQPEHHQGPKHRDEIAGLERGAYGGER